MCIHGFIHLQVDANKAAPHVEMKKEEKRSNSESLDSNSIEPEDLGLIEEVAGDKTQTSGVLDGQEVSSDILLNDFLHH